MIENVEKNVRTAPFGVERHRTSNKKIDQSLRLTKFVTAFIREVSFTLTNISQRFVNMLILVGFHWKKTNPGAL